MTEPISSIKKSQLARIDGLPLANQKIPTPVDPIRNFSGRPRISIRESLNSKIDGSSWIVSREGHWGK